jgi:hypothetical protein
MSFDGVNSQSANMRTDWTGLPDPSLSAYDVSEFLPYDGHRFLQAVYRCILKRYIEPESHQALISRLYSGLCTKEEIVWNVATSTEAGGKGVRVSGLGRANFRFRLFRIRLIGPVLRWLAILVNLPHIEQQLRSSDMTIRRLETELQQGLMRKLQGANQELAAHMADMDLGMRDLRAGKADRGDLAAMDRTISDMADQVSMFRASLIDLAIQKGELSNASRFDEAAMLERLALFSRELRQLKEQVSRKADVLLFADLSRRLPRKEPIDLADGRRPAVLDFKASAGSQSR